MEPMSVEESSAFVSSTISASSMVDNESKIDGFRAVAGTTDEFANDFSKVVANDRLRNLITSPLSVQVLLAMATYGARGATATQMRSALHIPNDDVVGQSGYQSLIERLNIVKGVDLRLASKIYTSNDSPVKPAFKDLTAQRFLSSSQEVDFSDAVGSARTINAWCEEQTNYRIRDLIRPDSLRQGSSLILVNAVYFKGQWTDKFDRALTRDRPFHVDKTTIRKVPTMFMERDMRYGNVPEMNSRLVEIAYQGGEFSMIIILPNDIDGLGRVRDNLHKVNLSQTWLRCSFKKVNLYLPKFKIERTLDLKAALQNVMYKCWG